MPAATCKADLRDIAELEYSKLQAVLNSVPETARFAEDPESDGCTPKDIVGHRAHWIDLFLGWYAAGQAGEDVSIPAPGYRWSDLKLYNADLRVRQARQPWDTARENLARAHKRLIAFIDSHSESDLYGGPMAGGNNKWTPGRWAEAAGPSHYRSAGKYIRKRLRTI